MLKSCHFGTFIIIHHFWMRILKCSVGSDWKCFIHLRWYVATETATQKKPSPGRSLMISSTVKKLPLDLDIFSCAILMTFWRAMVIQNAVPKSIEICSSLVLNHTKASLNPQIHRCRKMIMFRHVQPYWKWSRLSNLATKYGGTGHRSTLASATESHGVFAGQCRMKPLPIALTSCHWAAQHCSPTANRCRRSFWATVPAPSPEWQRQQGTVFGHRRRKGELPGTDNWRWLKSDEYPLVN